MHLFMDDQKHLKGFFSKKIRKEQLESGTSEAEKSD